MNEIIIDEEIRDKAILLTQYAVCNCVTMKQYKQYYFDEEFDRELTIFDYNEYASQNNMEYVYDDLDTMLQGRTPTDIANCITFGKYNASDVYFMFDGYGNVRSYSEYEAKKELIEDEDFIKWYIEKNDLIDEEEAETVIKEANRLIREENY